MVIDDEEVDFLAEKDIPKKLNQSLSESLSSSSGSSSVPPDSPSPSPSPSLAAAHPPALVPPVHSPSPHPPSPVSHKTSNINHQRSKHQTNVSQPFAGSFRTRTVSRGDDPSADGCWDAKTTGDRIARGFQWKPRTRRRALVPINATTKKEKLMWLMCGLIVV